MTSYFCRPVCTVYIRHVVTSASAKFINTLNATFAKLLINNICKSNLLY